MILARRSSRGGEREFYTMKQLENVGRGRVAEGEDLGSSRDP